LRRARWTFQHHWRRLSRAARQRLSQRITASDENGVTTDARGCPTANCTSVGLASPVPSRARLEGQFRPSRGFRYGAASSQSNSRPLTARVATT
jgi:hypothetical protein